MCEEFSVPGTVRAQEVGCCERPVSGVVRAVAAGLWTVRERNGSQLVLDDRMAVRARFAPPGDIGDEVLVDVERGLRYAVFAGVEGTVVVGADGETLWRRDYATRTDANGETVSTDARFSADGRSLYAFVPDDRGSRGERLTVSTSDWDVVATAATKWTEAAVSVGPDGTRFGYSEDDGHHFYGYWTDWSDGAEAVMTSGYWACPVPAPNGAGWLAHNRSELIVGDDSGVSRRCSIAGDMECEDEDCDVEVPDLQFAALAHLSPSTALCAVVADYVDLRHVLFGLDPLAPAALVEYPAGIEPMHRFDARGDGVWVSVGLDGRLRSWTLPPS